MTIANREAAAHIQHARLREQRTTRQVQSELNSYISIGVEVRPTEVGGGVRVRVTGSGSAKLEMTGT